MAIDELYISIDIEADGRVPGLSSMLSLGAAAYTIEKEIIGTFTCNFELLPDATPEAAVMQFWENNKDAYQQTRQNCVSPESGAKMFVAWLNETIKTGTTKVVPVFVGYPAVYDFKWIDYYCIRFTGSNPFGHSRAIDIKTLGWARIGGKFSHATKRNFPKSWFDPMRHSHIALGDAIEQGALFINILREMQGLTKI